MSLQNIQTEFAEILLSYDESTNLLQPLHNVSIYRQNIAANLINTLCAVYPLVVRLVGEDFFHRAANEYIKHYPSCSANLHDYGQYLSDFLTHYPPVTNLTYLPEVATFEWISHTLHFAADPSPFNTKTLEIISPEQYEHLHFILHPASQIMQFHYPILRIIDLCKGETNEQIDVNEGGVNLLIIRRDLDIMLKPLSLADYTFLTSLQAGLSLLESLKATLVIEANFKLEEKLPTWIQDKTIVDIITY